MVEAKLRVEMTETRNGNKNPFYGNIIVKKVVEDILCHDYDKREDIAPCGVHATIAIDSKVTKKVFDIKISGHYLESEDDGHYTAYFTIDEKIYEVLVTIIGSHIKSIYLLEWLEKGYFDDGDDADNVYDKEDFTTISELIC